MSGAVTPSGDAFSDPGSSPPAEPRDGAGPGARRRQVAALILTTVGVLALILGVTITIGRSLPGLPGLASDTWAMITAFSDHGLLAYVAAFLLLLIAAFLHYRLGRLVVLIIAAALLIVHASWILPRFVPDGDRVDGPARLTVLAQNMLYGEADPTDVVANAATADVLVLVEMTEPAARALSRAGIERRFPHAAGGPLPGSGPSGTRIYSRYPVLVSRALNPDGGNHNWLALVDAGAMGPVNVVAAHPTRPVLGGSRWTMEQENVRRFLPRERTVVAGDFNAVGSHRSLRRLAAEGFRDADDVVGAGWQPTFPSGGRIPPLIDIDHVLVSPDLTAVSFRTVANAGSDHRGVQATIALRA